MFLRCRAIVYALTVAFTAGLAVPPAFAQTPPAVGADQDHKGHHPDGKTPDSQAASPATGGHGDGRKGMMGQGGMMCGDMQKMMSMMQDMHSMMGVHAGMTGSRDEAGIAKLKAELEITDAQSALWGHFADALRASARAAGAAHRPMMRTANESLPARLVRQEEGMSAHLKSLQAVREALAPLYAVLSDKQKKIADGLRLGPMGMM